MLSRTKLPTAAIIATLALVGIDVLFVVSTEPLTGVPILTPTADDAVVIAKRTISRETTNGVMIIGDSSALKGLVPDTLVEATGIPFVNLGTIASHTIAGHVSLAIDAIEAGSRPDAIVVAVLPQTLGISESDARRFGLVGRDAIAYRSDSAYSPEVRERLDWWLRKHRVNRFPSWAGESYHVLLRNLRDQRGFLPEHQTRLQINRVRDSAPISRLSWTALERLDSVAAEMSIPVVMILTPKPVGAVTTQYVREALALARKLESRLPFFSFAEDLPLTLPDSDFGTETHLTPEAAVKYSTVAGSRLQAVF